MAMFPDQSDADALEDINRMAAKAVAIFKIGMAYLALAAGAISIFCGSLFFIFLLSLAGPSDYEMEKQIEEYVCELYPRTVDYCEEGEE